MCSDHRRACFIRCVVVDEGQLECEDWVCSLDVTQHPPMESQVVMYVAKQSFGFMVFASQAYLAFSALTRIVSFFLLSASGCIQLQSLLACTLCKGLYCMWDQGYFSVVTILVFD